MKYILCTLFFFTTLIGTAQTGTFQKNAYEKLLKKNVELLDKAGDDRAFENVLKRFERLKNNAPKEWLPLYYAAYCKIRLVRWNDSQKYLNEAITYLEKATKLNNNSEILSLIARAYMTKIELNFTKAPKYTNAVKKALQEAIKLDDTNPRVYLIYGRYYYYFPKFVGGDKEKAKQLFKIAEGLFETEYLANQENSTTLPHWGKNLNAWQINNF